MTRAFAALLALLPACGAGRIYRHTTVPLTKNFCATPSGVGAPRAGVGDIKHFSYRVDVMWDSNAIGDAAKAGGLTKVHFADIESLSVLGVWNQYWVHVYGE